MPADPPPPLISISDPNNPSGYGDVLGAGDEKAPWRPSRRQWQALLAAGLVLLVAVPPTLYLKHRGDERAADRQALAAVRLDAKPEGDIGPDQPLTLRNLGPDAITIVVVRVDREGYGSSPADLRLAPSSTGQVQLPFVATCPSGIPRNGPSGVLVTVRTARGAKKVVRVDIRNTDASYAFVERIKGRCGLYAPHESLQVVSSTVGVVGRELRVHADVTNRSRLRRDVTGLFLAPGFRIRTSPGLPLVVPPSPAGRQGEPRAFDARITVSGCAAARQALRGDPQGSEQYVQGVEAQINGSAAEGPAFLYLSGDFAVALRDLVAASC